MKLNGELVKCLGEGAYGSVDLIKYTLSDGSIFHAAVKVSYPLNYDSLKRELKILRKLRECPRIVKSFGNSLEEGLGFGGSKVYKLILEYASEGSLHAFIDKRKLPEPMIKDFTRMILEGLITIHGNALEVPECLPCDAREFIDTCFARNPEERGSASELLLHRFLSPQEEEKKAIPVAAAEGKGDSLPLKSTRGAWNKSMNITKKPLKKKIFPSKPLIFKKILNSLLTWKIMPMMMKRSGSNLVSVQ